MHTTSSLPRSRGLRSVSPALLLLLVGCAPALDSGETADVWEAVRARTGGGDVTFTPDGAAWVGQGGSGVLRVEGPRGCLSDTVDEVCLVTRGIGAGPALQDARFAPVEGVLGVVAAERGPLQEAFSAASGGLGQAWVIPAPVGDADQVRIEVDVEGARVVHASGDAAVLSTRSGATWRYTGLAAWDATGRALPAELSARGDHLAVAVDTTDATFPVTIDPVLSSTYTTLSGTTGEYGVAIGFTDVNADGFDDVLVGDQTAETAILYRGSASGASTSAWVTFTPPSGGTGKFGGSVSSGCDVNGDGYGDVGISAREHNGYTGRVYIYHGGASGPDTTADTTLTGSVATGLFGESHDCAGDVNGDGYDDYVVGANWASTTYVYYGSAAGLSSTPSVTLTTGVGYFGRSVDSAGDVNGDGYDDIVVGSWADGSNTGAVWVYHGSASGIPTTASLKITGSASGGWFGFPVFGAGDVNGDGYDDIVASAYVATRAYVFHGGASGITATSAASANTTLTGSGGVFGYTLGAGSDLDGDGYADVAVGAFTSKAVYVYRGSAAGVSSTSSETLTQSSTYFGYWLTGAGDVNGDGADDLGVGAYGSDRVYVYYGVVLDSDGDGVSAATDCDDSDAGVGGPSTRYADADGDGYGGTSASVCPDVAGYVAAGGDCDDGDSGVYPGAAETCDGLDEDCDGAVDEGAVDASTWYADADGDGYGDAATTTAACAAPAGWTANASDCDDADAGVYPGAAELCDGIDQDCDGAADEGVTMTVYLDGDGDGSGDAAVQACEVGPGQAAGGGDCDDGDAGVYPGAPEVCDGADQDCDGVADEGVLRTFYADADDDGFGDAGSSVLDCAAPAGYGDDASDCDDTDPGVFPGAPEVCDGVDEDCDGAVDEDAVGAPVWYADADGDGYGDATAPLSACEAPSGYVSRSTDCDDTDATVNPGAFEVRGDGKDNDCRGGDAPQLDEDGDGWVSTVDCDDNDAAVYPGAAEVCDNVDQDCDGSVDESVKRLMFRDSDGDGRGVTLVSVSACPGTAGWATMAGDCDDTDAERVPGVADVCDGKDNDCDGRVDERAGVSSCVDTGGGAVDRDGDGWGSPSDCAATDASRHPGAVETCNGLDDDCDGAVDEMVTTIQFLDADGDGWGSRLDRISDCPGAAGYTSVAGDCDDSDATRAPGLADTCDGIDNDCDDVADERPDGECTD